MNDGKTNIEVLYRDAGDIKFVYSKWITKYIIEWQKLNPGIHAWNGPVDGPEGNGIKTLFQVPNEFLAVLDEKGIYYKEV